MSENSESFRTHLAKRARSLAVDTVKPRVDPDVWDRIVDPRQRNPRRTRSREQRHAEQQRQARLDALTLNELAVHFRTDKWGRHRYTQHYARHLDHLRDRTFTLLELGIGGYARSNDGGASLRMWQQYFPHATIIGLDIEDKSFVEGPRIRIYQGSQVDHELLQRVVDDAGSIDVVIDDGSHRPEHIRETFAYLFPRLAPDGVYAIEDIQTSYWPNWGGSQDLHDPSTSIALVKDLVDGLNYEEFLEDDYRPTYTDRFVTGLHAYHNLVFVEKGENLEGTHARSWANAKASTDPQHPAGPVAGQRAPFSISSVVPGTD